MPDDPLWQRMNALLPAQLHTLGLPHASAIYRYRTPDGYLWGLTLEDDRGWTLVLTHTAPITDPVAADVLVPGRLPTLADVIVARRQLVPARPLMVVLLASASERVLTQMHTTRPGLMPPDSGLPTTVRCVEAHLEFTDDVVLGVTCDL